MRRKVRFELRRLRADFQLLTRARYAPWLRRLSSISREVRLSAPAMETLAVVAYRQPVLRAEIEAVRGVQCGEVLRQLIERDLVRIAGRSEELGRPLLYGTTKQFLQVFGLRHLEDLPRPEFLPITKLVTEESADPVGGPPTPDLQPNHQSREKQEETDMTMTIDKRIKLAGIGAASVTPIERPMPAPRTIYAAKAADDDEDEEEEDEDDSTMNLGKRLTTRTKMKTGTMKKTKTTGTKTRILTTRTTKTGTTTKTKIGTRTRKRKAERSDPSQSRS